MEEPRTVTQLLQAAQAGEDRAVDRLVSCVYDELRRIAERQVARELRQQSLQPTALVHEAYLRLLGGESGEKLADRRYFFAAAAEAMRRILVDRARRRAAQKRGGNLQRVTLSDVDIEVDGQDHDLLALNEAVAALETADPGLGELVKLRYFTGLTIEQVANALGKSPATIKRDWLYARAWLHERLS